MRTLILLLLLPTLAMAGGGAMDGGGGNLHSEDAGAAWFLGSEPVRYCVRNADDFVGPENIKLQELAESVFSQWRKYIKEKRIDTRTIQLNDPSENQDRTKLVFNTEYMDECNEFTDLTLYFGVKNKFISSLLGKHDRHLGLSYRTSYDPVKGRGKGFIWIRNSFELGNDVGPDWSQPERLRGILLHEVGHILGNGHSRGTIMDAKIANFIIKKNLDEEKEIDLQKRLSHIDFKQELYLCKTCPKTYNLDKEFYSDPASFQSYFKEMTGREPVGETRVTAQIAGESSDWYNTNPHMNLVFEDERGEFKIPIYNTKVNHDGELYRNKAEVRVFKRTILDPQSQRLKSHEFDKEGMVMVGCLLDPHYKEPEAREGTITLSGGTYTASSLGQTTGSTISVGNLGGSPGGYGTIDASINVNLGGYSSFPYVTGTASDTLSFDITVIPGNVDDTLVTIASYTIGFGDLNDGGLFPKNNCAKKGYRKVEIYQNMRERRLIIRYYTPPNFNNDGLWVVATSNLFVSDL